VVQVVWSARAQRNVIEIEEFVAGDKPIAAERLASRLKGAAAKLSEYPDRGRLTRTGIRELAHVHPYVIRYRHDRGAVIILEIRHAARRPR
jgi:plasmid stabilization system protein ParE